MRLTCQKNESEGKGKNTKEEQKHSTETVEAHPAI